jgi:5-methylcytosine-specific restriction endonuclease McrA
MKTCSKCGVAQAFSHFHINKTGRDGLKSTCKTCSNATSLAWREKNVDRVAKNKAAYHQANRTTLLSKSAQWRAANPERVLQQIAAWRLANPEKIKAANSAYRLNNPEARKAHHQNRRARKKLVGGKLSSNLVKKLFELQRGKCACCKQSLGKDYHLDHILPLALGGSNTDDNMQLLKARCNMEKKAKHPVDFMQQRGYLL